MANNRMMLHCKYCDKYTMIAAHHGGPWDAYSVYPFPDIIDQHQDCFWRYQYDIEAGLSDEERRALQRDSRHEELFEITYENSMSQEQINQWLNWKPRDDA